MTVRK